MAQWEKRWRKDEIDIYIFVLHISLVTIDICVLSQLLLHQVGSKAMQEGGGAVGNLVQVRSQWKQGQIFWPSQNVGDFVQKLKAGAAAEAKGEENPGLVADNSTSNNNNNINNINNNTNNNNNRKGKRNGFKTLVKKEQVSSADIQKHSTSKKAAEPESQNPALPVDWSSWDAS